MALEGDEEVKKILQVLVAPFFPKKKIVRDFLVENQSPKAASSTERSVRYLIIIMLAVGTCVSLTCRQGRQPKGSKVWKFYSEAKAFRWQNRHAKDIE